jgi:hypothetical protein
MRSFGPNSGLRMTLVHVGSNLFHVATEFVAAKQKIRVRAWLEVRTTAAWRDLAWLQARRPAEMV